MTPGAGDAVYGAFVRTAEALKLELGPTDQAWLRDRAGAIAALEGPGRGAVARLALSGVEIRLLTIARARDKEARREAVKAVLLAAVKAAGVVL